MGEFKHMGSSMKGNLLSGKILKGTINDADSKIVTSSIPSKFDNIISRSQTISAFGSGVGRFKSKEFAAEQKPGPGSYSFFNKQSPSISKKGYGPFLSKLKR